MRYFLSIVSEGNITRAADVLHITQPTLSRQLADLERELDTTLILRGKKGLVLTEDGLLFRQRAEEIVELANRLEGQFAGKSEHMTGTVNIGASEAVGSRTLAKIIRMFSEKYPLVQFHLYNETADYIQDRLDQGLADVGLVLEPVNLDRYESFLLPQEDVWGVLVRTDHPLASKERITPEDIFGCPLILPMREKVRDALFRWMGKEEKDLRIPLSYTLLSNAVLLVEEGMGCAFCLNGALAAYSSPKLTFIPMDPKKATRSLLIWKKNHLFSPATSLFIQEIQRMDLSNGVK